MNWYRGGIAEAVAHSKAKDAIFVVYIVGQDEMSTNLTKLVNNDRVRELLESDDFVAIKIEGDSQSYVQFMAIYKVVPVPSIFFIGRSGTPLDIGTGVIGSVDELVQKIEAVLVTAGRKRNSAESPAGNAAEVGTSAQAAAAAAMKETNVEKTLPESKAPIDAMQLSQTSLLRNSAGDDSQQDEEDEKNESNEDAGGPLAKRKKDENTEQEQQNAGLSGPSTVAAALALAATAPAVVPGTAETAALQQAPTPALALSESEERLVKVQQMIEQKRAEQQQEELLKQQQQKRDEAQQKQQQQLKQQKENEQKALQKQQQDKEKSKEKGNETDGKDEAGKQNWQHQQELKNLQDTIRRERLAAQEERDRIRAQIAGDRAERAQAHRAFEPGPSTSSATAAVPAGTPVIGESLSVGTTAHETRLQLRLPGGIQRTRTFGINDTLSAVREYVHSELLTDATVRDFRLATTYPRREFSFDDDEKTLTELNLVPNAVLLVLNNEQANRIVRSRGLLNMLTAVLWAMITPAAKAFDYVSQMGFSSFSARINERLTALGWKRPAGDYVLIQQEMRQRRARDGFIAPSYSPQQSADAEATKTPAAVTVSTAATEPTTEANKRNYSGEATIHRLRDTSKNDDEDKTTYNGNSTQQQ